MTNKGSDGVWYGRRKVGGSFSLRHFTSGFWRHRTLTSDDGKADAYTRERLVDAVEDRIGMWSGRVPCWRPSFAKEFAGVELEEDGKRGWIRIVGHRRIGAVEIIDGRLAAIRSTTAGRLTRYHWKKRGGTLLPSRVERRGNGNVDLDWEEIEPGWWLPKRAHFTEIFGRGWGPETIEMTFDSVAPLRGN